MALSFLPGSPRPTFPVESVSYWNLNVTVLRAKTQNSQDYWSESDLYVALTLPTATATTRRTTTINNKNNPEWNEGFSFRVPTKTKNILEIRLYDEDLLSGDDLLSTVLLDLETLEMDSRVRRSFSLDPETKDVLELEFELTSSEDETQEYLSNGILMAAPLSVLNISVQKIQHAHYLSCCRMLTLCGAYEKNQPLDPEKHDLLFHMNRELETELGVTEMKVSVEPEVEQMQEVLMSSVPLKPISSRHLSNVSLTVDKDTVDLHLELKERGKEDLGVRLSQDIPSQEKVFLQKRRRIVAQALQALLGLESPPSEDQVPTIAVVVSGGGARACTGLLGSLKGLKEMGVLDAVTYITTLSGSTWAMSALCQHENWSQNLESIISETRKQMTKTTWSAFTLEKMQYYYTEMEKKEKQGHLVSYIDMAGLIAEHFVFGQKNTSTLSDQKKTVTNGQNPLPIYTAVNVKEAINGNLPEAEWVEFTPFEVGLQKYGAFIRAENFDSEFFLGHLIKKLPELRLPFLIGIWSSAFSVNFTSLWKAVTGSDPQWTPKDTEVEDIETDNVHSTLDTVLLSPEQSFTAAFARFFKNRPIINQTFNFTRGLSLHQKYSDNSNFLSWKDSHPDAFPNQLTPSDPTLHLIDSGHSINIGCPPVLRPERHADVIIILSYSWDPQNIFKVMEKTCEFCEEHKVPFPSPDFTELRQQPQREVYVYEDPETPAAPIVLHLPLVNISFRDQKAPGVKRETEEELAAGRVDVSSSASPYTTKNMTYSEDDYDSLIELTRYNALHSRDAILSAISKALTRLTSDP
ncbi:cytosolic phospholipase A2 zeta-like isoform X2 [Periophthalmus magnuspinnatus]|uniref:cytosolic phospholipase A2 zeta-like isoform X2 n=1 Tax=Periophthalmus magnuspinnatus TaxID=409849 RepID=UPI00145ACEC3|nr:cytosolic phospholipase A2 zeta-like isoform X2 [Periophthalmus magnuspinnatus]